MPRPRAARRRCPGWCCRHSPRDDDRSGAAGLHRDEEDRQRRDPQPHPPPPEGSRPAGAGRAAGDRRRPGADRPRRRPRAATSPPCRTICAGRWPRRAWHDAGAAHRRRCGARLPMDDPAGDRRQLPLPAELQRLRDRRVPRPWRVARRRAGGAAHPALQPMARGRLRSGARLRLPERGGDGPEAPLSSRSRSRSPSCSASSC